MKCNYRLCKTSRVVKYKMNCTNKWRRDITMLPPSPPVMFCFLILLLQACSAKRRDAWGVQSRYQGLGPSFLSVNFKFTVDFE